MSEAPCFLGGSCRTASAALISEIITAQHIGIRWFWRISADLAMKLTRIDFGSGFGCVFSPSHPGAKGYPEILLSASCSAPLAVIINSADLKR